MAMGLHLSMCNRRIDCVMMDMVCVRNILIALVQRLLRTRIGYIVLLHVVYIGYLINFGDSVRRRNHISALSHIIESRRSDPIASNLP